MSEFIDVGRADMLPDPGKQMLELDDRLIVLFRVGGKFYCVDDLCSHDGGPLSDGAMCDDHFIACPRHGAKFDVRTGKACTMPATEDIPAHEVKVENGRIWIKLAE